ncbi:ArdC family protein [Lactobacillus delbrueckii subsp. bulgaricus]|nr:hypothetical protein [Lactobacillus delbrueckii subsp. bulgaricus]
MFEFSFPKSAIKNGPAAAISAANGEKEGWQLVAPGLAWIEFKNPSESLYLVPSQRGKGRKYAVITWEPGERNSASVYLIDSISKLEKASRLLGKPRKIITGQELAELLEPAKPAKKTSQASEKKAAKKPAKDTGYTVVTLDHKKLHIKPAAKKPAAEKPAEKPASLQFGPALVADKEGKTTIASLLHAGKAFAGRTVPAEFSARFKKYSDDNQLLLYLQGGPDLGPVSTYRGWLKQGRQVTKGQHGLKILAPKMVIKEDGTKAIDGLRLVTLFSVNQTEKIESQEA